MSMQRRPAANSNVNTLFKKGDFLTYRATNKFHVGSIENLQVAEGDTVEFDGHTLRIGNDEHSAFSLRGAVRSGWLVPESDVDSVYEPRSAGVVMSPADTAKSKSSHVASHAVVSEDERVVGDRQDVRKNASAPSKASRQSSHVTTVGEGMTIGRVNVPAISATELKSSNSHLVVSKAGEMAASENRATLEIDSSALRKLSEAEPDLRGMTAEELETWKNTQKRRQIAAKQAEAKLEERRAEAGLPISEYSKEQSSRQQQTLSEKRSTYTGAVSFDEANPKDTMLAMQALDQVVVLGPAGIQKTVNAPSNLSREVIPVAIPTNIVRTSVGVDWDLGREPHVRMSDAVARFGWSKDILLAIAKVEGDSDVSRFLSQYAQNFCGAKDAGASAAVAAKDAVDDEVCVNPEVASMDAEIAAVEPDADVVQTATGITWNTQKPKSWMVRAKLAIEQYGDKREDLLSIADVESEAVAKRIRDHVAK